MKRKNKLPVSQNEIAIVYGNGVIVSARRLQAGDIIEKNDLYERSPGVWEKAPCHGLTLQEGVEVKFVRPKNN